MNDLLLVTDIGNTHIVIGVFKGDELIALWRLDTRQRRTENELEVIVRQLFDNDDIDINMVKEGAVACVTPPVLPTMLRFYKRTFNITPTVIGPGVKSGVVIAYENPREVGADRIANAAAALARFKAPLIVVDFGTAITFDAISKESEYLGGIIVPGIRLALSALYHHAAKLPEVALEEPPTIIGRNTVNAIQSGAYFGYAALVDGIVEKMKEELGDDVTVIATGGEAASIAPATKSVESVEETLTLEGIKVIHEKNRKRASPHNSPSS